MKRFTVSECFSHHVGWMSLVKDNLTGLTVYAASGKDHEEKAADRAAQLEEQAKEV